MDISKVQNIISPVTQSIKKGGNRVADFVGGKIQKSSGFKKAFKLFEPNGGDNSFLALAGIMVGAVLIPRINTALKRNPDNKEATNDEIKEILFRDVQTILIMLFALKSMNTVVSNISTKITGVPMVDVPYKPLFDPKETGFAKKAGTFFKNLGSNIIATINPTKGSVAFNEDKINENYTNLKNRKQLKKFFLDVDNRGGKKETVFQKIKNSIIESLDKKLEVLSDTIPDRNGNMPQRIQDDITRIECIKSDFERLTLEDIMNSESTTAANDGVMEVLTRFFDKKDNAIASSARKVNSMLRTAALAIEVLYLGFGLPALNQRRLEKKYLSEKPVGTGSGDTFTPIYDKNIKAQQVKLFNNFIK